MPAIEAGTMIDGRYRVRSRIGSGGMADVYVALDEQLGREVAVKLLHRRFAEDAEFVERFRREASAAASLSHPNVVSVYDRGEWDDTYYIAMEYLEGRSLKALIRERGSVPALEAIELTEQVLRAARFAHRRGVVHRDLKPLNVIVDDEGRLKVTDFGIARAGASEITQTGSIMGTAQYLSPEQAQGHAVGPQSDIYSIGILLYELLTGRVPFEGDSAVTIALKQISEMPLPPSAVNPDVPPALDAIVLRALAKDAAERFADADEFLAALAAARDHLRADAPDRTVEFGALGETAVAAAAAYPLVPAAEGPYGAAAVAGEDAYLGEEAEGWQGADGDGEPEYSEEGYAEEWPQRRRPLWPWVGAALVVAAAAAVWAFLLLSPSKHVVPLVVGETEAVASAALQSAGFTPLPEHVTYNSAAGLVIRQSPAGGARAAKGSLIHITVSDGPGNAQVPDVSGERPALARKTLRKAGFQVAQTSTASSTVPSGLVISTVPTPLTELQLGASVTLEVSSGPAQVAVPNVVGRMQIDAATIIQAAGFKATPVEQQSTQPPGTVIAQSPAGNANAPQGSVVVLTVAKAFATVVVPAVVGARAFDAANTLAAAGLSASSTYRMVTNQLQDGYVLAQSPAAGTTVRKGATVALVLGRFQTTTTTTPTTPSGKP